MIQLAQRLESQLSKITFIKMYIPLSSVDKSTYSRGSNRGSFQTA